MKRKWLSFIAGFITCAVLAVGISVSFAAGQTISISALLNNSIKIMLNGNEFIMRDASGIALLPITFNGRIYLPVRPLAEVLNVPIEWEDSTKTVWIGEKNKSEKPAWHLVETKYFVPNEDLDVNGGPVEKKQSGTGALLLDYYQDYGDIGNRTLRVWRTDGGGTVFADMEWQVLWDAPPSTLYEGQFASINVEHKVLKDKTWSPPPITASFDAPGMAIGFTSASPNKFRQPVGSKGPYKDTREEVYSMKATMTTVDPVGGGKAGAQRAIYISFGEGYGMRYTYEWR